MRGGVDRKVSIRKNVSPPMPLLTSAKFLAATSAASVLLLAWLSAWIFRGFRSQVQGYGVFSRPAFSRLPRADLVLAY